MNHIARLISKLTLEEQVELLTGRDFWSTHSIAKIGLEPIVFSDGPSGVRGSTWDERDPSICLPSSSALVSTWDTTIAYRYGQALGGEARVKSVNVLLGPTVNLQRSPFGGRSFEGFGEDPTLAAAIATQYARGVQSLGVAATMKHYVANDSETDRFTVDVVVDERTLHEIYLRPLEDAIVDGQAWAVMSAYNEVDGTAMTESHLLTDPLRSRWGFDGVVVSDWTAVRSLSSAAADQDLVMPGPDGPWDSELVKAVESGLIDESLITEKVRRILTLASRVGAVASSAGAVMEADYDSDVSYDIAVESLVLLKNDVGILPLEKLPASISVIGHNALEPRIQGGGSATVVPRFAISPLEGIQRAFAGTTVNFSIGCLVHDAVHRFKESDTTDPVDDTQGVRVTFEADSGEVLFEEHRHSTSLFYFGGEAPVAQSDLLRVRFDFTPSQTEGIRLGFAGSGTGRLSVDGDVIVSGQPATDPTQLGAAFLAPGTLATEISVTSGVSVAIEVEYRLPKGNGVMDGTASLIVGWLPSAENPDARFAHAVESARASEVAVVVVGTTAEIECEGFDRETLALPGEQDRLVEAIAAVNPRTIVIVNSGAPVLMPWRNNVAAIIACHFGGQDLGRALGDVLAGAKEPGGRLAVTWPSKGNEISVPSTKPQSGALSYDEGIHVGYRGWLRNAERPAFEFGWGLGYTDWKLGPIVDLQFRAGEVTTLCVPVVNAGKRAGKCVVQVYASREHSGVERPDRWLVGHGVARSGPGESSMVEVQIDDRAFRHWDRGWQIESGRFRLHVGTSVGRTPYEAWIEVTC